MKALWFVNVPLPGMVGRRQPQDAGSGGWMLALLDQLRGTPGLDLVVACASPGLRDECIDDTGGIRFITIRQGPRRRLFGLRSPDEAGRHLRRCALLVRRLQPDIVHVHGTERFYGLLGARGLCAAPVVVSLQGILEEYCRWRHHFGVTPIRDVLVMHDLFHVARGMGPIFTLLQCRRAATREGEILRGNRWFLGRTRWDHAHLMAANPAARYFHVGEVLRDEFYGPEWNLASCQRHRVIFTNANAPSRGTEVVLQAIAILRNSFPGIRLGLAGGCEELPYGRQLLRRIGSLGLTDRVDFLGRLAAPQMVAELLKAHAFVMPSLLENSPNSLCEAQLIGMPCVASYAGGIPSLVRDGETGLLFPPGDAPVLAHLLAEIFQNDEVACALGQGARREALGRHDPAVVAGSVLRSYAAVIADAAQPTGHMV